MSFTPINHWLVVKPKEEVTESGLVVGLSAKDVATGTVVSATTGWIDNGVAVTCDLPEGTTIYYNQARALEFRDGNVLLPYEGIYGYED